MGSARVWLLVTISKAFPSHRSTMRKLVEFNCRELIPDDYDPWRPVCTNGRTKAVGAAEYLSNPWLEVDLDVGIL